MTDYRHIHAGRRPLPLSIYAWRLRQLEGRTFTQWPKRERDRLRQQRHRARKKLAAAK